MSIGINPAHKGRLHEALGKSPGAHLSTAELMKHKNSKNAHMRKMISFALAARKWKHKGHKK